MQGEKQITVALNRPTSAKGGQKWGTRPGLDQLGSPEGVEMDDALEFIAVAYDD